MEQTPSFCRRNLVHLPAPEPRAFAARRCIRLPRFATAVAPGSPPRCGVALRDREPPPSAAVTAGASRRTSRSKLKGVTDSESPGQECRNHNGNEMRRKWRDSGYPAPARGGPANPTTILPRATRPCQQVERPEGGVTVAQALPGLTVRSACPGSVRRADSERGVTRRDSWRSLPDRRWRAPGRPGRLRVSHRHDEPPAESGRTRDFAGPSPG
jgi:hypothetical protein